ncbi:MAG: HAMP domain-containing histidine kinase [Streptomycetaceae bacterium]|nr:HAMP domain-containing histidine kinase [Streptomycetaceae bacterium]
MRLLPRTVRARATAAASLVVAAALSVGAVVLLLVLEDSLRDGLDRNLTARARDLAAVAPRIPAGSELEGGGDEDIALVVGPDGGIVASSASEFTTGAPPFTLFLGNSGNSSVPGGGDDDSDFGDHDDDASSPPDDPLRATGADPELRTLSGVSEDGERETYRVAGLSVPAANGGGRLTVYVAATMERVDEPVAAVRLALLFGLPALLALLTFGTWLVVGRALRPVEAIRAEVADISEHALDRRVPVPASDDEIGRLARTMNAMLARLEHAGDRQRAFVADASHELQTPLASFRTQLEVGLAHPDATDWPATARGLLDADLAMERLVRDLLFLAREDADAATAPPATLLDLDVVVLEEAARLRAVSGVRVDTSGVSAAPVRGSRDDLTRLVRNLLDNAERHAASAVTVTVALDDGGAVLVVQDDGPGVPEAFRGRLFERFTRADAARARTGGTGLGLAIVKAIAERHGGTVEAGGRPDGASGARFTVRLPAAA